MGRYPINFHNIGIVHGSYVRGNSIWKSYNRAIAVKGVHNLRVRHNVIYDVMGHAIFTEDAIEKRNLIQYNLVASVKSSFSVLYTD